MTWWKERFNLLSADSSRPRGLAASSEALRPPEEDMGTVWSSVLLSSQGGVLQLCKAQDHRDWSFPSLCNPSWPRLSALLWRWSNPDYNHLPLEFCLDLGSLDTFNFFKAFSCLLLCSFFLNLTLFSEKGTAIRIDGLCSKMMRPGSVGKQHKPSW